MIAAQKRRGRGGAQLGGIPGSVIEELEISLTDQFLDNDHGGAEFAWDRLRALHLLQDVASTISGHEARRLVSMKFAAFQHGEPRILNPRLKERRFSKGGWTR